MLISSTLHNRHSFIVYSCLFVIVVQTFTCTFSSTCFPLKQLYSHALLRLPIFRLFCNQCSSHASILNKKPLSLIVYSCLFVVILQTSMCALSITATVLTCTLMTANFWFSCNWYSYLIYLNLNNLHLS